MSKARERAKATKARFQSGRVGFVFDGVPEQDAQAVAIWQRHQAGLLDKLGKSRGLSFQADGYCFLVASKGNWEKVYPKFKKAKDMVVVIRPDSDWPMLKSLGVEVNETIDRIKAGKDVIPPRGWVYATVEEADGSKDNYWVNPSWIKNGTPCSELSDEQIGFVAAIQRSLFDVDATPLETWLYNMSCNRNPNNEIGILAKIATIIKQERPLRTPTELENVYHTLILLSTMPKENNLKNLLSVCPKAKTLKNLERVVFAWTN